jgi:hypothetical protein
VVMVLSLCLHVLGGCVTDGGSCYAAIGTGTAMADACYPRPCLRPWCLWPWLMPEAMAVADAMGIAGACYLRPGLPEAMAYF